MNLSFLRHFEGNYHNVAALPVIDYKNNFLNSLHQYPNQSLIKGVSELLKFLLS